jgi:hypothetical protein
MAKTKKRTGIELFKAAAKITANSVIQAMRDIANSQINIL